MPGFPSSARPLGYARALSCLLWAAGLSLPLALEAEELSFDTAQEWNRWKLPLGAVQVTPEGRVQPLEVRKNVDAVTDAAFFAGGIREVGSNAQDAESQAYDQSQSSFIGSSSSTIGLSPKSRLITLAPCRTRTWNASSLPR